MTKRIFDVVSVVLTAPIWLPLFVLVSLFVFITLGRPVLFRQTRPGRHGVPFEMIKFRTMLNRHDPCGRLLPDEERLTKVGRLLRSTSLDELPELLNVLRGDMSLVGPRPLLMEYLPLYSSEQARRHQAKPGITGWAQVNGRNSISWDEKFKLDIWYVEHQSLMLDIRIIATTLIKVSKRHGISSEGVATAEKFRG